MNKSCLQNTQKKTEQNILKTISQHNTLSTLSGGYIVIYLDQVYTIN